MSPWLIIPIFYAGAVTGYLLKAWLYRKKTYGGKITVNQDEDKLSYMLELDFPPADLAEKQEILFKIDAP